MDRYQIRPDPTLDQETVPPRLGHFDRRFERLCELVAALDDEIQVLETEALARRRSQTYEGEAHDFSRG